MPTNSCKLKKFSPNCAWQKLLLKMPLLASQNSTKKFTHLKSSWQQADCPWEWMPGKAVA